MVKESIQRYSFLFKNITKRINSASLLKGDNFVLGSQWNGRPPREFIWLHIEKKKKEYNERVLF